MSDLRLTNGELLRLSGLVRKAYMVESALTIREKANIVGKRVNGLEAEYGIENVVNATRPLLRELE